MMMDIVWRMFIVLVSGSVGQCHHDFPSLEFDSQASAEGNHNQLTHQFHLKTCLNFDVISLS